MVRLISSVKLAEVALSYGAFPALPILQSREYRLLGALVNMAQKDFKRLPQPCGISHRGKRLQRCSPAIRYHHRCHFPNGGPSCLYFEPKPFIRSDTASRDYMADLTPVISTRGARKCCCGSVALIILEKIQARLNTQQHFL